MAVEYGAVITVDRGFGSSSLVDYRIEESNLEMIVSLLNMYIHRYTYWIEVEELLTTKQ